jgi:hypothetical protein
MAGSMEEEGLKRKEERWEPQSLIDVVFSLFSFISPLFSGLLPDTQHR